MLSINLREFIESMIKNKKRAKERKFVFNNRYYTISIYTIITVMICAVMIKALFMWDVTKNSIKSLLTWSVPFSLGIFIALLLFPLVIWLEKVLFSRTRLSKKMKRLLSVILIYIVFIGLVVIGFCYIIPQVWESVSTIIDGVPRWYNQIYREIMAWATSHPDINTDTLQKFLEDYGMDAMKKSKVDEWVKNLAVNLVSTSLSIVSVVINIFITLVVSIYLLLDTESFKHGVQRIMYALLSEKRVAQVNHVSAECYSIFSQYVSGKILDSLIIGIICFFAMTLLRLPYALVISVIVGITNMIPYFGPYIGAIPGAFVMLMVSPVKLLIYLIMILILQQLDGLFIGPKILGDSTGLGPAWIIFSVSAGGSIGGVLGMFVGVPVVAMIGHIMGIYVDYRINKKKARGELSLIDPEKLKNRETKRKKKLAANEAGQVEDIRKESESSNQ